MPKLGLKQLLIAVMGRLRVCVFPISHAFSIFVSILVAYFTLTFLTLAAAGVIKACGHPVLQAAGNRFQISRALEVRG